MSKRRNKLSDYLAYLGVRLVAMFVHMFDWRVVYAAAGWLGNTWCRLDRRHRERAAEHVRQCFPEWDEPRVQRTVQGSFRNLVYLAIEVLLTTRLITRGRWRRHIELADMREVFRLLMARRGGMLLITGHFGGWEVSGYTVATLGFKAYALARPLDNPYLNEYLLGVRQRNGLTILDKGGAMSQMNDLLGRDREIVGFIADQDAGKRGVFVDFFGRAASSYRAPALTAMRYNVPVVVGYGRRIGEGYRFRLGVERVIHPHEWADQDDPVRWITQEYTAALERVVRMDPQQDLWIYRRWKTRPKDETPPAETPAAKGAC